MATVDIDTTNTYASQAAIREFENKLARRLPDATKVVFGVTEAKRAPVVEIRESGKLVALVTMAALPNEDINILGLPQTSYSPHVVKIAFGNGAPEDGEDPAIAGITAKARYLILGEAFKLSTKVEIYEDVEVDEDTFGDAPVAEWYADMYWGANASV